MRVAGKPHTKVPRWLRIRVRRCTNQRARMGRTADYISLSSDHVINVLRSRGMGFWNRVIFHLYHLYHHWIWRCCVQICSGTFAAIFGRSCRMFFRTDRDKNVRGMRLSTRAQALVFLNILKSLVFPARLSFVVLTQKIGSLSKK